MTTEDYWRARDAKRAIRSDREEYVVSATRPGPASARDLESAGIPGVKHEVATCDASCGANGR